MLTSKIRTTVLTLAVTAGIAAVGVAPAVSQAQPNNGGFSKSSEGMKAKQHDEICENLGGAFEREVNAAGEAYEKEGVNSSNFKGAMAAAEVVLGAAQDMGCGWASAAYVPSHGRYPTIRGVLTHPAASVRA